MLRFPILFLFLLPVALLASAAAADPGHAGVPGETTCMECHGSAPGSGSVSVTFSNGLTYAPGVLQHLVVTVADPSQKRWGFQLTARPESSPAAQGGTFTPGADGYTQLACQSSNLFFYAFGPRCGTAAASYPLQYIEHTDPGTRQGQPGSAQFAFDWTPPANATGPMVIYVAGNAANGDGTSGGDRIYLSQYTLMPTTPLPAISQNGVVNAASFGSTISAGSWVAIQGTNLSASTRLWGASDFVNGALPTQLEGVKVAINGKPAFVEYISPTLVNVQAPTDSATGPVAVQVTNANGTSQTVMANLQTVSPAFFLWNGKYSAATRPDYSLIGPPNLFPEAAPGVTTAPAKPGDVIVLWATGLGPTNPVVTAGVNTPSDVLYNTANPVTVTLGNLSAKVLAAVLTPGNAGLYQVAVTVPSNAPNGDLAINMTVNGVTSPTGVFLTVQQ